MLRLRVLSFFLLIVLLGVSLFAKRIQSNSVLRRLTNTPEESLNLNPFLSDNGRVIAFESTADLATTGRVASFHALRANLTTEPLEFEQLARSRSGVSGLSADGRRLVFATPEDLLGRNPDRNSEIFFHDGLTLKQITETTPTNETARLDDGNFEPSLSADGRWIAFSSNRSFPGPDQNKHRAIYLYDVSTTQTIQVTSIGDEFGYTHPKISGDGQRVFFVRSRADHHGDLVVHDRVTNQTRMLVEDLKELDFGIGRIVNHNGTRLVYSAEVAENDRELFVYDERSTGVRQITQLGARNSDVALSPTLSGDGKRITFATRRRVLKVGDGSVELYVLDIPTGQITQITNAPAAATADVVSSLNFDGSSVVFNFPRILSGPLSNNDFANNSEIYQAMLEARPASGVVSVVNAAAKGNEPASITNLASDSIVSIHGNALAFTTQQTKAAPQVVDGTTVKVNGLNARLLYVSPTEVIAALPGFSAGTAELVVTNSEGFESRSVLSLNRGAPGVFTSGADGRGEAIVIDADKLLTAPFDPSDGRLRLAVFATGCRHAMTVKAALDGEPVKVEAVLSSPSVPGLDEVHFLVPEYLRGTGQVTLMLDADGIESNPTTLKLSGSSLRDIMINEFLADPADGLTGDANHDGVRDASADEFIELINTSARDLDISGYQIETRANNSIDVLRHKFSTGAILPAGTAIVVFGGGKPVTETPVFAGSQITKASSGALSLNNNAGTIRVRDAGSTLVTFVTYGSAVGLPANLNQSLTRLPEVTGGFVLHTLAAGSDSRLFSPGSHSDFSAFLPFPPVFRMTVSPSSLDMQPGTNAQLTARAFDTKNQELSGVIFQWGTNSPKVVEVDQTGLVKAIGFGTGDVFAVARGVQSNLARITVPAPTPTPTPPPTPTPTPSPSPTPAPTPTPLPSPSPNPSPTPTPTPSPSPSASPTTSQIVISEFRTRGPNGANDEFVEVYNNSDSQISVGGWKIRASNNSGTVSTRLTIAVGVTIPARGHFLATNSGYSGRIVGDQTYSSGVTNDGGVAITLPDDTVVDQLGLSAGSAFKEGTHLVPLTTDADQSYERKPGASTGNGEDTNDNFSDFRLVTPSSPQNLSSIPTPGPIPSPSPVVSPTPVVTPTPIASPSPSPSVVPTPSPTPSPSPSATPTPAASPSPSPSPALPQIVISQVFGGGGNSGAPFRNDFIEIFNRGNTTVIVDGWSVQYSSATASTWSVTNIPAVSLSPGQYLLIQESSSGANGVELPAPDAVGSINLAATAGKVALVNTTTAMSGACPSSSSIVDFVGYGNTANCFRGVAGPAPANATAISRKENGCMDSQNNSTDFVVAPPNPRNRSSALNPCVVAFRFENDAYGRWAEPLRRIFSISNNKIGATIKLNL